MFALNRKFSKCSIQSYSISSILFVLFSVRFCLSYCYRRCQAKTSSIYTGRRSRSSSTSRTTSRTDGLTHRMPISTISSIQQFCNTNFTLRLVITFNIWKIVSSLRTIAFKRSKCELSEIGIKKGILHQIFSSDFYFDSLPTKS